MDFNTFLESIVNIKDLPLLGEEAHAKLSPPYRLELAEKYKEKRKTAPKAGVMALFYPDDNHITHLVCYSPIWTTVESTASWSTILKSPGLVASTLVSSTGTV